MTLFALLGLAGLSTAWWHHPLRLAPAWAADPGAAGIGPRLPSRSGQANPLEQAGADSSATSRAHEENLPRLREGTQLTRQMGQFRSTGDRLLFTLSDGSRSFTVLENLALDRIAGALDSKSTWIVSGLVTEYRGGNYLLVSRAVAKGRPHQPGANDPLADPRDGVSSLE